MTDNYVNVELTLVEFLYAINSGSVSPEEIDSFCAKFVKAVALKSSASGSKPAARLSNDQIQLFERVYSFGFTHGYAAGHNAVRTELEHEPVCELTAIE